jgi:hypothetical protein
VSCVWCHNRGRRWMGKMFWDGSGSGSGGCAASMMRMGILMGRDRGVNETQDTGPQDAGRRSGHRTVIVPYSTCVPLSLSPLPAPAPSRTLHTHPHTHTRYLSVYSPPAHNWHFPSHPLPPTATPSVYPPPTSSLPLPGRSMGMVSE